MVDQPLVGHPRDAVAWHLACGLAMVAMLVATFPARASGAVAAAFVVGSGWCLVKAVRHGFTGVYLRLTVCCAAMAAMLIGQSAAHAVTGPASTAHVMGGALMGGMSPAPVVGGVPTALLGVLVLATVVVAAVCTGQVLRRVRGVRTVAAAYEAVLAAAMATMLVALI